MSHWTTVKTEIKDLALAGEILREAGFAVGGQGMTTGWGGQKKANCALTFQVKASLETYTCGITEKGELLWDSWKVSQKDKAAINALPQAYAKAKIQKALRSQGFSWGNEEVQADGAIRMTVRRWA